MTDTRHVVRRMLTEAADAPVPGYFYLAIDFRATNYHMTRAMDSLMAGRLEGVRGIGGGTLHDMIMDWGHLRDLLIRMPGSEVAEINDISLVRYDEPDYLMAGNMSVLGRLFNSPDNPQQILTKMGDYAIKAMNDLGARRYAEAIRYGAELQNFGYWVEKTGFQIDSVEDMTRGFLQHLDILSKDEKHHNRSRATHFGYGDPDFPSEADWNLWFRQGVKNMGALYSAETEWVLSGDALAVPESSHMWAITPDPYVMDEYRDWKVTGKVTSFTPWNEDDFKAIDRWYESVEILKTKYASVKIISSRRAQKERKKLFARRERQQQAGD